MSDYKLAILKAIESIHNEAKERKENLQFFEDLNFICEKSREWVDIGRQRLAEGKSHEIGKDYGLVGG